MRQPISSSCSVIWRCATTVRYPDNKIAVVAYDYFSYLLNMQCLCKRRFAANPIILKSYTPNGETKRVGQRWCSDKRFTADEIAKGLWVETKFLFVNRGFYFGVTLFNVTKH